jgi:Tol biopolymer transport system component
MDLWKQPIAADGRPDGEASAVTSGIGMQVAELSADGRRLAYSKGRPVANVWRVPISTLERGEAVWADAEQITFDQAAAGALDLSPDGERLLLDSDRTGNWDIWVVPARGGDMRPVTVHRAPDRTPTWSPDGERVAFYSYRSGNRDIWVAPVEGGPAVKLTRDSEADMFPMWSPDGREITFYSARAGSVNAFAMPASGGDVRALTSERTTEYFPQWSPDGAWLAFASNRVHDSYHVWRIPVSGGPLEQVTRQRAYFYRWSPDGTHLYYHSPGSRELWSVSLSDGVERPVTRFGDKPGRLGGLGLAVGDDYLYFTWENDLGDIWVMDLVTEGDG